MKRGRLVMFAWAMLCFAGTALVGVSRCRAQVEAQPGDGPLYTLHAYANLIQIPTLVLSWKSQPLPPIPRQRFAIRLDSGPAFRPTAMHIEGDDAIDLVVLLDASGDQKELLSNFANAMDRMARTYLLPHDHVTVYAIDCKLVRTAAVTADDAAGIQSSVAAALSSPALHGVRGKFCGERIHLLDSLVNIGNQLTHSPNRRVILTIGDGEYDESIRSWAEAKVFLSSHAVAVFSIHESYNPFVGDSNSGEQLFRNLCESTGGLFLGSSAPQLGASLSRFIALVRGRYIIEFPRPGESRSGSHEVEISVPGTHDFVVHTGAIVPLPDPSTLADPNTVPNAISSPATYGKRPPIVPHP
jgi:hypothetical protein